MRLDSSLKNKFALAAVQLQMRWKPRRPFDKCMICHARAIDLGQDIAGEISLEIGILHLRQGTLTVAPTHMRPQDLGGIVAFQFACKVWTEELTTKCVTAI